MEYSRYIGKQPQKDTTAGDLRRQIQLVQDETQKKINRLRQDVEEKMAGVNAALNGLTERVTALEAQASDDTKGFNALDGRITDLDERVTALEEAQE